ncbi:MAG: hypothetical protein ACREPM_10100 [Gemmatimonadaceae bacterium]
MTVWLLVLAAILLIGIVILIAHFFAKDALTSALTSLVALLSALVAAMAAPDIQMQGAIDVQLPWGRVNGQWARVDPSRPMELWVLAFITIGVLTIVAMQLIAKRAPKAP